MKEDYWLLEEKEGKIYNKPLEAQQLSAEGNLEISGKMVSLGSEQLTWVKGKGFGNLSPKKQPLD